MSIRKRLSLLMVLGWFAAASSANAGTIVFNNAPGPGSQQNWVLGMDFIVNSAVTVTQLGAFDSGGDGFGAGSITVGIFDLTTLALVAPSVTLTGTEGNLVGGSRFVAVTPFSLAPGTYSIVAAGFTGANWSGNSQDPDDIALFNNVGGALSLIPDGGRWIGGNTFALPPNSPDYSQGDPVFQAGTFSVPDGGLTLTLLGGALAGLGLFRRRRQA